MAEPEDLEPEQMADHQEMEVLRVEQQVGLAVMALIHKLIAPAAAAAAVAVAATGIITAALADKVVV